ncbi:site-specific recombinase XerD [Actinoplanes tereljensis]|uniref:Tyr recombinase domain-containing protein n=1 Tax=Paractinoplanes tereljensis TaxID=571912 RepID=A0A919NYQ4_9ACTN|nr:hypothetical protein Ate02nite_95330 [Actinoplanes tereljensis]
MAAAQLAKYLADESPDPDADDAAQDPTLVTKVHIESFQAWMIETRSASTALNKQKLVPIMGDDDTKKLLDSTKGKTFMALRDEALIRLYYNTGARLSEIGNLLLTGCMQLG